MEIPECATMTINRFAIITGGFTEPPGRPTFQGITGIDWSSKTGRALLITRGYLNRGFDPKRSNFKHKDCINYFLKLIKRR